MASDGIGHWSGSRHFYEKEGEDQRQTDELDKNYSIRLSVINGWLKARQPDRQTDRQTDET